MSGAEARPSAKALQRARVDAAVMELASRRFLDFCTLETTDGRRLNYEPPPAAHHRHLIAKLEAVARGETIRLMILMPPGSAKSTYASKLFPGYYLGRHLGASIIAASHTDDLASNFGRFARNIVGAPLFREVFGRGLNPVIKSVADWQMERLAGEETQGGGEYFAVGVGGAVTGHRADLGIIDDPIKGQEQADSPRMRDRAWDWYRHDFRTRLKPAGALILITTRWHEDDLAGRILPEGYAGQSGPIRARDGEVWEVVCFPAEAERDDDPLGRKTGEWLWPEWFLPAELMQQKRILGERGWSALYQQRPSPEQGLYFKREWLKYYDTLPPRDTMRFYGASDYAVSDGAGDWTVHVVVGVDPQDRIYLVDMWRERTSSMEWVESFCDLCARWKPLGWAEEKGQIQKSVGPFLLKRLAERKVYVARQQFTSASDKPTRAQAFRGRLEMGMVFLPRDAEWTPGLVSEMLSFPAGESDDQVDALSLIGRALPLLAPGRERKEKKDPWREPTLDELLEMNDRETEAARGGRERI